MTVMRYGERMRDQEGAWATHRRAIRGAAAHCGSDLRTIWTEVGQCWGTSAAHNQARRIAKLGASFGSSHRLRLPEFGQEKTDIRAEGYLPKGVRAGKDRYPGRRVSARGGSGRKRLISRPKGICRRGSGQERADIRAEVRFSLLPIDCKNDL